MARIRDFNLSPALADCIASLVQDFPETHLKDLGTLLPGGFTKPAMIRDRLTAMAQGTGPLPDWFLDLLRTCAPGRGPVSALRLEALRDLNDTLSTLLGPAEFQLALLLDEREEIRKCGASLGENSSPVEITEEDKDSARELLLEFVNGSLLQGAGIAISPPSSSDSGALLEEPLPEQLAAPEDEKLTTRLRAEIKSLKTRFREKAKEQHARSKQDLARQVKKAEALQNQLTAADAQIKALQSRLSELEKHTKGAIDRGVQEGISEFVGPWLAAPRDSRITLPALDSPEHPLSQRAREALEAQAREDQYTGNRLRLENSLQQLRLWRERLYAATTTAINPLRSTSQVLAEVDAEIDRLKKKLNGAQPEDSLLRKLLIKVNQSETCEDLTQLSRLAESLADKSLLDSTGMRALHQALHRKYSLLEEKGSPRSEKEDPGWALRRAIRTNANSLVVLDGHNILFLLKDLFAEYYENGAPGAKARQALMDWIVRMVRNYPSVQVKICFDGPKASLQNVTPNVQVEFSGGQNAHRADIRIEEHLHFKSLQSVDQKVFVVTNDRELRQSATKLKARPVSVESLAVLLAASRSAEPAPPAAPQA